MEIIPVNKGNLYGIVNAKTENSINNSGGDFQNGNPIIEYTSKIVTNGDHYLVDSENQQWYF